MIEIESDQLVEISLILPNIDVLAQGPVKNIIILTETCQVAALREPFYSNLKCHCQINTIKMEKKLSNNKLKLDILNVMYNNNVRSLKNFRLLQ